MGGATDRPSTGLLEGVTLEGMRSVGLGLVVGLLWMGSALGADGFDLRRFLAGRAVYRDQCVYCHGEEGKGDGLWAKDMRENRPRDFTSGVFKFRSTPMGFLPTDADLERTIRHGVATTAMPAFESLSPSQIDLVIDYIQTLSERWRDPTRRGASLDLPRTPPSWWSDDAVRSARANDGRAVFERTCAPCHGGLGRGDGVAASGLRDVWGHPITPADLSAPHWKSGGEPVDWFRSVATGLDGTPMVGFASQLDRATLWSVVAYIDSLRQKPGDDEPDAAASAAKDSKTLSRPNVTPSGVVTMP